MEIKKMKTAVIGCGAISDVYLNNLKNRFEIIELVACSDLDKERMCRSAEKYQIKPLSADEIIADPKIEIVVNLTNPSAHYAVSKRMLEGGKHVYSEKPIAVNLEQANALCEAASANHVRLGVSPDTFLGGGFQTAKKIIDRGAIGRPLSFVVSLSRDFGVFGEILPHLYKNGGGILFDMAPYYLTCLGALFGPAKSVSAVQSTFKKKRIVHRVSSPRFGEEYEVEVPTQIAASIQYGGGIMGTLHMNSDCLLEEDVIFRIYGTEGILSIGNPNEFGGKAVLKKLFSEPVEIPFSHGFCDQARGIGVAEMAWAIRQGRAHRASMELARNCLEIMEKINTSAESGRSCKLTTDFAIPSPLCEGVLVHPSYGDWCATEESALIDF